MTAAARHPTRCRLRCRNCSAEDGLSRAGCCWMSSQRRWPRRIDAAFLAEAGWDPATWVLTLPAEHPLLGRTFCRARGCQTTCAGATRVCLDCQRRLTAAGLALEDFALLPPPQGKPLARRSATGHARVPGARGPWVTSGQPLCPEHLGQQEQIGVSTADFTARADAVALPSHGTCAVASCPRQLPGQRTPSTATRICSGCASPPRRP